MSYCRMGWDGNDLYMFENVSGVITCSGCRFDDPWIVDLNSVEEALAHVAKHRAAGHHAPADLEEQIEAFNPWNGT